MIAPDASAREYLAMAAFALATEDGFAPPSEAAMAEWIEANAGRIGERASDFQAECFIKAIRCLDRIAPILSGIVYRGILA